jgi:hypothetical protein
VKRPFSPALKKLQKEAGFLFIFTAQPRLEGAGMKLNLPRYFSNRRKKKNKTFYWLIFEKWKKLSGKSRNFIFGRTEDGNTNDRRISNLHNKKGGTGIFAKRSRESD